MNINEKPVIVEETFNVSIESVWDSITIIDQMRQWYFDNIPSFIPEVGFETQFNVKSEDRNFLHMWKVTKVEPQKLIEYNWKYKDYEGDSFVVFELIKQNDLTKLILTHRVQENFPENIPEFSRESGVNGWEYFIKGRLKEFLENK